MTIGTMVSLVHFLQGKKLDKLCIIIILSEMGGELADKDNLAMNK